ncbi:MAG: GerW family sporulation protein [Tepidanaerobacteraceae bacterium]|jgi:sporulation protein YtfJ
MDGHPIESLIRTAMDSIKEMVDVNTIVGDPVETADGSVIIPVSRVTFGFAAGGSEFNIKSNKQDSQSDNLKNPFGGGSGAGVSVQPVAFMVVGKEQIRLLPVSRGAMFERVIDLAPHLVEQIKRLLKNNNHSEVIRPK